jgi:hypothetical protein
MTNHECTQRVLAKIQLSTKEEIAKKLGIARPTLDARLKWHKWKLGEKLLIEKL